MIDFPEITEIVDLGPDPHANEPARALMVFAHGIGQALVYSGPDPVRQFITDTGGDQDTFDTERCPVDFQDPGDGLYIVELRIADDGPGDWPGSREGILQLHDPKPATREQWAAHCDGDWPWELGR